MAEWTEAQLPKEIKKLEFWTIYFDGSLQLQGAGAGIVVICPHGETFKYILQLHFPASNNVAEYEALLLGLRVATSSVLRYWAIPFWSSAKLTRSGHATTLTSWLTARK